MIFGFIVGNTVVLAAQVNGMICLQLKTIIYFLMMGDQLIDDRVFYD